MIVEYQEARMRRSQAGHSLGVAVTLKSQYQGNLYSRSVHGYEK